jgi:hypothetical protein
MRKKLLAASVIGVVVAPMAANAEHRFSGELRGSISHVDEKFDGGLDGESFHNNDSRVDFQGNEGIGIYHLQVGIRTDDDDRSSNRGGATYLRQGYAGLKGSYGTLTFGRRSPDYKWFGGEEWDPFWDTSRAGFNGRFTVAGPGYGQSALNDPFIDNSFAYLSPVYHGFQINGGVYLDDSNADEHTYGGGIRYKHGAFVVGSQYLDFASPSADDIAEDSNGNGVLDETDFKSRFSGSEGFRRAVKGYGGVQGKNFLAGVSYEHLDGRNGFRADRDYYYAHVRYNATPATWLAASYGRVDVKEGTSNTDPSAGLVSLAGDGETFGLFHKLADKTTAYGLYSRSELENDADAEVYSVGLNQAFEFGD